MSESPQPAPHPQLQHPGVAPAALAGFAEQLRELWLSAGKPSYRDISGRLHARTGRFYSKSVIGDVLAGRRAPKQTLLVDLVTHLGGDPVGWSARLTEVLRPAVGAGWGRRAWSAGWPPRRRRWPRSRTTSGTSPGGSGRWPGPGRCWPGTTGRGPGCRSW